MNEWFKNNWKAFALVSTLLIAGATGLTDLVLEVGERRANETHYDYVVEDLNEKLFECEEKCDE